MIKEILAEHYRLISACRHEAQLTADAYGIKVVRPLEVPPPAWVAARQATERDLGVKLRRFFR